MLSFDPHVSDFCSSVPKVAHFVKNRSFHVIWMHSFYHSLDIWIYVWITNERMDHPWLCKPVDAVKKVERTCLEHDKKFIEIFWWGGWPCPPLSPLPWETLLSITNSCKCVMWKMYTWNIVHHTQHAYMHDVYDGRCFIIDSI